MRGKLKSSARFLGVDSVEVLTGMFDMLDITRTTSKLKDKKTPIATVRDQ
jgi:hypothetical protein